MKAILLSIFLIVVPIAAHAADDGCTAGQRRYIAETLYRQLGPVPNAQDARAGYWDNRDLWVRMHQVAAIEYAQTHTKQGCVSRAMVNMLQVYKAGIIEAWDAINPPGK